MALCNGTGTLILNFKNVYKLHPNFYEKLKRERERERETEENYYVDLFLYKIKKTHRNRRIPLVSPSLGIRVARKPWEGTGGSPRLPGLPTCSIYTPFFGLFVGDVGPATCGHLSPPAHQICFPAQGLSRESWSSASQTPSCMAVPPRSQR